MKYLTILFTLLVFLFSSCGDATSTAETKSPNVNATSAPPPATLSEIEKLPSIPVAILQKVFDESDYVDYLFYESNFSMSISQKPSIQQTLSHISQEVPVLDKPCKGMGRVFYEINGNTELEAEIYFSNECQHFVFMKDNKRLYANNITADGVNHFNNIFNQASKMGK